MARKKISQLESAVDVTANDLIQVIDVEDGDMAPSGTNKKISAQTLGNYLPVISTGSTTSRSLKDRFADTVNVKDFGAKGDGVTDDTAAIQAAIDFAYLAGGKEVFFNTGKYLVSSTIEVPQRVTLTGESLGYVNPYTNNLADAKGSILFLKSGSNCDVVLFRCRLTNQGGTLIETAIGGTNSSAGHFGGMKDMIVWGNRSATANPPTTKNLNSSGSGIRISGSRHVFIFNVVCAYCADNGLLVGSFDYGTGSISSNNLKVSFVNCNFNAGAGFYIFGGDSNFSDIVAGYNGGNGISWGMSGTLANSLFWNNLVRGVSVGGFSDRSDSAITGIHSYDNGSDGFLIFDAYAPALNGCIARGNGMDGSLASTDRCNFSVRSNCEKWNLSGCTSFGTDYLGNQSTRFGFYINNTTYAGGIDGCRDFGSATPYLITSGTNILSHGGVTSTIKHPPINVDGGPLSNVGTVRFDSWQVINTLTSDTITIGSKSLLAMNLSSAGTVTDLSYPTAIGIPFVIIRNLALNDVTFVHNAAKLRLSNGTNAVLGQNEAIMFVYVAGTVWQQVGGSF